STGDVGFPVAIGNNKLITWSYNGLTFKPDKCMIKLIADDKQIIDVDKLIKEVDTIRMKKDLEYIYGERNSRNPKAKKHLDGVGKYIKNTFENNKLDSYYH